jgi:hypothetical protein
MNSCRYNLFFLSCLFGMGAGCFGADTPADSGTPATQPPNPYTDQGTSTMSNVPPGGYEVHSPWPNDGWSRDARTTRYQVLVAPPVPPALGEPIPARPTRAALAQFAPTSMLSAFVYEPFFTPLSPLLFSEDLSRNRREKLNAYRTSRSTALAALHAKLDSLQSAPAETRQQELAAFAREQAPALANLERTAEEMRANYVTGGLFESGTNWNDTRNWRLGSDTRWESNADEIKVMFGAAYFQEGLSPEQRRLLRELAMETMDAMHEPMAEISLSAPGPFFYFSPEMARIRLPAQLPAELQRTIQSYQNEKAELKQELRDLLYKQDRAVFFRRNSAIKALAEQQAARFADLEQLAEKIRIGLAPLPNPARPPSVALPHDLVVRANQYHDAKDRWQRTMLAKLESLRNALPEDRVEFVRQKDSIQIQIVGNRGSKPETVAKRAALQAELVAFNDDHTVSYAALAREKEAVLAEILKAAGSIASQNSKTIETLLAEFNYAFGLQERWERYADYETAVLQPGLSPEQRRLLFGAAIEEFELPLAGNF